MRWTPACLALLLACCGTSDECEQAADCPGSEAGAGVCLDHVERGETYCTTECTPPLRAVDDPCPTGRGCANSAVSADSPCEGPEKCANSLDDDCDGLIDETPCDPYVCIERILECVERERCGNSLDDNCDGQTDEAGCNPFICFSDGMCGEPRASACTIRDDTRECAVLSMPRNVGSRCESNDDCYNRHCAEGYCAPACSFDDNACLVDGYRCVNTDLGFNACLRACLGDDVCNPGGETDGFCSTREICDPTDPAVCFSRDVCVR